MALRCSVHKPRAARVDSILVHTVGLQPKFSISAYQLKIQEAATVLEHLDNDDACNSNS